MKNILWFATLLQELFSTLTNFRLYLLSCFLVFRADRDIGLEFRLGTGGAHHDGAIIFQQELEHQQPTPAPG